MKKTFLIIAFIMAAPFLKAEDLKLFKFAESLFDSGDYYRAIGEYKRYMFYNSSGSLAGEAAFKIGLSDPYTPVLMTDKELTTGSETNPLCMIMPMHIQE